MYNQFSESNFNDTIGERYYSSINMPFDEVQENFNRIKHRISLISEAMEPSKRGEHDGGDVKDGDSTNVELETYQLMDNLYDIRYRLHLIEESTRCSKISYRAPEATYKSKELMAFMGKNSFEEFKAGLETK